MAGRRAGRALLGSGLLAATLLGGAGGYGAGLVTGQGIAEAEGYAAPLAAASPMPPPSTPTATAPPKQVLPDRTEPLDGTELRYKTARFTARSVVRSDVSVRIPDGWKLTQPDPPREGRYTDPTALRWIRIEAGFTIRRAPADSMAARIAQLKALNPNLLVEILAEEVDAVSEDATLVYSYVPEQKVRYVIIRWVANKSGQCILEIAATGLPQDKEALLTVLERAAGSATRVDSPLR